MQLILVWFFISAPVFGFAYHLLHNDIRYTWFKHSKGEAIFITLVLVFVLVSATGYLTTLVLK